MGSKIKVASSTPYLTVNNRQRANLPQILLLTRLFSMTESRVRSLFLETFNHSLPLFFYRRKNAENIKQIAYKLVGRILFYSNRPVIHVTVLYKSCARIYIHICHAFIASPEWRAHALTSRRESDLERHVLPTPPPPGNKQKNRSISRLSIYLALISRFEICFTRFAFDRF